MAKSLLDLGVLGKEVVFDVEDGDPISVYIRKLQPFEVEKAVGRAQAKRAVILSVIKGPHDTDEYIELVNQLDELVSDREELIKLAASDERLQAYRSAESEVAHLEKWAKDDYLIGLQEAWSELKDEPFHDEGHERHEDANKVFMAMKEYQAEVDEMATKSEARILREFAQKSDAELEELSVRKIVDLKADTAWLNEFKLSSLWLSVKKGPKSPDRETRYFESRSDLDYLAPFVLEKLLNIYDSLSISQDEGKD